MSHLSKTLAEVRRRIEQGSKRSLNEQNTKATLIEPVMRALGWDTEDVEEVVREFRVKKRDKPVDYGLLLLRNPRLFIEAKALGMNLEDRRWANQIMGYAAVAGVEWMVLTDGNEYRIYNTHAPVAVDQKLFRTVRVTGDVTEAARTLELLSKDRLEENRIEVLWRAQFVDSQVQEILRQVFSPDHDLLLVNYVAGRAKNLSTEDIRDSLRRCHATLDFPLLLEVPPAPTAKPAKKSRAQKKRAESSKAPASFQVTIRDLIRGGLLEPRTKLARRYKGKLLSARVEADGRVKFGGTAYDSPSMAAGAARASVIGLGDNGQIPATNGWTFWEIAGSTDKDRHLADLRKQLLDSSGTEEAG